MPRRGRSTKARRRFRNRRRQGEGASVAQGRERALKRSRATQASGVSILESSLVTRPHLSEHGASGRRDDDVGAAPILGRRFTTDESWAFKRARQALGVSPSMRAGAVPPFATHAKTADFGKNAGTVARIPTQIHNFFSGPQGVATGWAVGAQNAGTTAVSAFGSAMCACVNP